MSKYVERAMELLDQGHNCAQSSFIPFCEDEGLDVTMGLKISSSFGGGIGRLREACGGFTGICMACGFKYGYITPTPETKVEYYKLIKKLSDEFIKANGSISCKELLGLEKNPNVPLKHSCRDIVINAVEIFEKFMEDMKN